MANDTSINDDDLKLDSLEDLEAEALKELNADDNDNDDNDNKSNNDENEDQDKDDESEDNHDDKDNDNDDDAADDNDDKSENKDEDKVEFKPIEFEIAGQKIILKTEEELRAMLSRGAESLSKQDNSLGLEKTIIEQGKITAEDLKLLVDAKNGDPKAIAKLAANSKIDILEVEADDADKYVPTFEPVVISDTEKVAREIASDTAHAEVFTRIASGLPNDFKQAIMSNAGDLKTFSEHIKSGLAQQIIPEAMKLVYTQNISFSDAYVKVGQELVATKPAQKKEERTLTDREKELRKKASENAGNGNQQSKKALTVDDIANMPIEEFEKLTAEDLE